MSIWTSLEPASTTVDPGGSVTVRLRLRNTGDVVDEYRCVPVGDIAPYATVEPPTIRLFPGTTGTVQLTFAPPRTPDATAGPNPYGIRITPTEHPEATTVPEGNLTITPFTELRAELVPHTVKGRFRGRPKLAIDNLGNTRLTASVTGNDNGDQLSYQIHPANVQIEPGRAAFVDTTLRPRQITWFGRKENRPYHLAVQRSGTPPLTIDGTYVQKGVLPRWLATFLSITTALTLMFVIAWFAYKPRVTSLATEQLQQAAATALPGAQPSPGGPAPGDPAGPPDPPLAEPSKEAADSGSGGEQDSGSGGTKSGGGSGGGGTSPTTPSTGKPVVHGPLPFRPGDGPNLFVQFAQVRLATVNATDPCRLTAAHTTGVMDPATVAALTCWQTANDRRNNGLTVKTDGAGNLGRSSMTALLMIHLGGATSVTLTEGKNSSEVPWVENVMIWALNNEFDGSDIRRATLRTRQNITYLTVSHPSEAMTSSLTSGIKLYQQQVGLPRTGVLDEATLAALKAGRVKTQSVAGTVPDTTGWPPPPM